MQPLSDRTAGFTDSVIRRMTRISNQYGAVNLSQGFPDFDPPKAILDRLAEVAHEDYHQYSITWGAQNFREALAAKVGVGAVPGSSFFREPVNHLIRFHFAKKDETLNDALNRLETLRSKIPARAAR